MTKVLKILRRKIARGGGGGGGGGRVGNNNILTFLCYWLDKKCTLKTVFWASLKSLSPGQKQNLFRRF